MKKSLLRGVAVSGAAVIVAAIASPAVSAQATTATYQVNLTQQNKSNASGTATVSVNGNNVTVTVKGSGFSANLAHAAHLHIGGSASCPAPSADTNKDGYVDVKEGESATGPTKVTLSTSGDTSTKSELAIDRAPKADSKGNLSYNRTFSLPAGVNVADLSKAVLQIHGNSSLFGDKTKYDGDKKSELDSKVVFETSVPVACGSLTSSPTGGAATGVGSVSGIESPLSFLAGAAALLGAASFFLLGRKRSTGTDK